jgi:hypothetical protein
MDMFMVVIVVMAMFVHVLRIAGVLLFVMMMLAIVGHRATSFTLSYPSPAL